MFVTSLKHTLFSLVWIIATIIAIPVILVLEVLYLVFSLGLFIFSIPFSAYKGTCRMISETMYLKIKSWENVFIDRFDSFIESKMDDSGKVPEITDTDTYRD